ncbi:9361_t:CDS:2, partial [Gigaspora margarita]
VLGARLYSWISDMRSVALAVTYNSLRLEMLKFVSEAASKSNDLAKIQLASTFKASSIWINHFLKYYNLALYRKTKILQKIPADLEQHLLNFQWSWADSYIEGCPNSQENESSLLVFDSFKAYLTDAVKANSGKTKKGNLKHAELHIICEWVLSAWAEIDPEIIQQAFCKCSISNAIDRSEDDEIYRDEILSNESKEICQDEPHYISDEQNITTINFSDEEDCDAVIDEDNDHDAIIDE